MKLDPVKLTYTAQLILRLQVNSNIEEWLQSLADYGKVSVEVKFLAKQLRVTNICELDGIERTKTFVFNSDAQDPRE